VTGPATAGWTRQNARHILSMLKYGRNPASTVYDSIGDDFFLALAPGWLNLGLWEGDGRDAAEAPAAVRRLVQMIATHLPRDGDVLDVGNGLAEQDPVIASTAATRSLTALNITLSQLIAGAPRMAEAGAKGVNGDATRMPLRDGSFDGVISVEAAFHFASRAAFFSEAFRVLRPAGVLSMSDICTNRLPQGPRETLAGVSQLRVWGLGRHAAAAADEIVVSAERAGFVEVRIERVGERVIGPALRCIHGRLEDGTHGASRSYGLAARIMLAQVDLLWRRRIIDYVLLRGLKPA